MTLDIAQMETRLRALLEHLDDMEQRIKAQKADALVSLRRLERIKEQDIRDSN